MTEDEGRGNRVGRTSAIVALVAAGETVFLLPFVLTRIFRPTFLDVFGIDNLELGTAFSAYGVVAMASYFLGGPLADRFPARNLIALALAATGIGGLVLAQIPSVAVLYAIWAFWGLTTILLFWAALLRATREWGGPAAQGRAYGLLEGGRGLLAAVLASGTVLLFAAVLPSDASSATPEETARGLRAVIYLAIFVVFAVSVWVWYAIPAGAPRQAADERSRTLLTDIVAAGRLPTVRLQAVIVVCAYTGYKATDDFSLLARDALGFDDVQASSIGTLSFWVRAAAAVASA